MRELEAWLLDLFEDPTEGMILYFITKDGQRLRLPYPFPIKFFATGKSERLRSLWQFLSAQSPAPLLSREQRMDVFTQKIEVVLAIQTRNMHEQQKLFSKITKAFPDLNYADADIQLSLRFSAATGIFPTGLCHITLDDNGHVIHLKSLEHAWRISSGQIPLRIMSLSPDRDPNHETPTLLMINVGNENYKFELAREKMLLVNVRALLQRHDPDILLTDWGDTWLMPLLFEMSHKNGFVLPLNREKNVRINWKKERSYFSYGQIVFRGQSIQLYGRCHIDRKNAVLWKDYELDGALEASRMTSLSIQTSARTSPGTGISAIETLTALREGILVPWQKQQAEMLKPASELFLSDQGGLVYQPKVGVHRDVAEIDFVSLYPSIMVYFNISPETILNDPTSHNLVPELGFGIDTNKTGLVPKALKPLLTKRVMLKEKMASLQAVDPRYKTLSHRSTALKWLLVTCFGYLGYKNARFGRIEAHQAVTAYGREVLLQAKEAAEEMGFEVLHLYVDALWVKKPEKRTSDDFQALLTKIQENTRLPVALDGVYKWLVFVPSRQNFNRPVPNRYFGVFQDGSIKVRGIEIRRHDAPPFISRTQKKIIELMAKFDASEEGLCRAIEYLGTCITRLRDQKIPFEDLVVRHRISRELSAYRTLSPAARAAQQLLEINKTLKPGQKISFLYTLGYPGVHAWDLDRPPDPDTIDIPQYQKLLLRAAATVLQPWIGSDENLERLVFRHEQQLPLPLLKLAHPAFHIMGQASKNIVSADREFLKLNEAVLRKENSFLPVSI